MAAKARLSFRGDDQDLAALVDELVQTHMNTIEVLVA